MLSRIFHEELLLTFSHRRRRQSLKGTRKVPRFPKKPDIMVRTEKDYDKRKVQSSHDSYKHNYSRRGDTVCKCKKAKITQGENNPEYSSCTFKLVYSLSNNGTTDN